MNEVQPKPEPNARKPRWGDELEITIESIDSRGRGVAHIGDQRWLVARAIPGARVRVAVVKRRRDDVEARVREIIERSPHAVEPQCAHVNACGGCSFQELAYAHQLVELRALVEAPLRARGLLNDIVVEPVVPAISTFRYRNKMEFAFSNRRWVDPREPVDARADFALGLHAKNLHTKVVDIHACPIQSEASDRILADARAIALEQNLSVWDIKEHRGLLRYIVLRASGTSGEVLVNLVTSSASPELVGPFVDALLARRPEITTLVHSVNSRAGDTALAESERVLHGRGWIRETVCGVDFAVSSGSFFQTNSRQAERLFEIVREEAALTGSEIVYDLYCGTGTIALTLARSAREVIGFELVAAAVADARANAERNGIVNARFVEGDALAGLDRLAHDARVIGDEAQMGVGEPRQHTIPSPDVCVVDPPRAGLHPKMPARLAALGARRIVYVSCNPAAAANDVAAIVAGGYALVRVRPIDLFPHTPHVETVLTLVRRP